MICEIWVVLVVFIVNLYYIEFCLIFVWFECGFLYKLDEFVCLYFD